MGAKGKSKLRNNNNSKNCNNSEADMDDRPRPMPLIMQQQQRHHLDELELVSGEDIEREESNIVINMEEDDDDDDERDDGDDNFSERDADNKQPKLMRNQQFNDEEYRWQLSSNSNTTNNNNNNNDATINYDKRDAMNFEPGQLVWFDPNLYGYSIPGKIVDFHPALNLLTVEAFEQPEILSEFCQNQNQQQNQDQDNDPASSVMQYEHWRELYSKNWRDDEHQSSLQLYQLSERTQLAQVRSRAPLGESLSGCRDLVQLAELSTESIVYNLKLRSSNGLPYTSCGFKLLISVNPNELVPEMYNLDQVNRFDGQQSSKLSHLTTASSQDHQHEHHHHYNRHHTYNGNRSGLFRWLLLSDATQMSPQPQAHIFAMAQSAIKQLLITGQDQCFVLFGECGSGKSESAKLLVQYFAATNKAPSDNFTELMLESQQLLESFGNAARRDNLNSSRFAKLIKINVSLESGLLVSAQINDLKLLDKSRIVGQQGPERNYHVFYELLAGLSSSERERYGLQVAEKYFYLNQGDHVELPEKDDAEDFRSLQGSMQVLGFSGEEQDTCFRILASILHLGNVYFHRRLLAVRTGKLAACDAGAITGLDGNAQVEGVEIGSDTEVRWVSHLLQIQFESVMQCLSTRTTNEPAQAQQQHSFNKIREKIVTPLNIDQALDARDALARALYACLFRWLLERLNAITTHEQDATTEKGENSKSACESLCEFQPDKMASLHQQYQQQDNVEQSARETTSKTACLAILDCFGFENLSENNFEQLCINLASELLQSHARRYLVKLELLEYERERLNWAPSRELDWCLSAPKSNAIVNLLARKPLGILPLLDDECNFPKGTDLSFMEKCHHNHATNQNYIRSQRASLEHEQHGANQAIECEFGIRHFGPTTKRVVYYQSDGFIEKNRDLLRPDLVELIQSSSCSLIRSMMSKFLQDKHNSASSGAGQASERTLTRTHDGRFVCMKPRQTTVSARFQEALASSRALESLGAAAQPATPPANVWFLLCLRPNRVGAPARQLFDVSFVQEQISCLNLLEFTTMRKCGFPVRLRYAEFVRRYQCLIEKCQVSFVEASKHKRTLRDLSIDIIELSKQATGCDYQFGLTKVFLQEQLYHHLEMRRLERYNHAIRLMQRLLRMWSARRKFLRLRNAACVVQARWRGLTQRHLYLRHLQLIVAVQRRWRAQALKRRHERLEAKRRARRALQLGQLQELQAQHARAQASHLRFRLQQTQQTSADIPADLARLYRAQRQWTLENQLECGGGGCAPVELDNYCEWSLGALEQQERARAHKLERLNSSRSRKPRLRGSNNLLSIPFVALIDSDYHSSDHARGHLSDHHEILAQTLESFRRDFATRLKRDASLARHLDELHESLLSSAVSWDEQYSLNQFVDQFYPIEAPQFGYSRLPITKGFSWHSLRRLQADWLRSAQSKLEAQQVSARFEQLKRQPTIMYKLILRYIDSNHSRQHQHQLEENNYNFSTTSSAASMTTASNGKADLQHIIKFKLMVDYLIVLCLREPLLRTEFYLQLASLAWQNPKKSSQNNLWKLMLNCLACFGPENNSLNCFLLQYINDYCLNADFRPLLLRSLATWLVSRSRRPDCSAGADEESLCSVMACQRVQPITKLEYLANEMLVSRLMLPVSAFADCETPPTLESGEAPSGYLNYSMRTLVELRPTDSAEQVARRTLEARGVNPANLVGWSLEIQHEPSALSCDLSCRLRGDESPFDHLARIEMLPQLSEMIEQQSALLCGQQDPAEMTSNRPSRLSVAYSMKAHRLSRRLSTQSQLNANSYAVSYEHQRLSCCSIGSECLQFKGPQRASMLSSSSSSFMRKRRNSSSGVWSGASNLNYATTHNDNGSDITQIETNNLQHYAGRAGVGLHGVDSDMSFRHRRRSMSVQDLSQSFGAQQNRHQSAALGQQQQRSRSDAMQLAPTEREQNAKRRYGHQKRRLSASSLQQVQRQNQQYLYASNQYQASNTTADWDLTDHEMENNNNNNNELLNSNNGKLRKNINNNNNYRKLNKNQAADVVSQSAMSDTSEAPSLASHVRDIKAPQNQGSQADVDRYLDDLFRPMLLDAELDELTDARSLATSIRGLQAGGQSSAHLETSSGDATSTCDADKRESRVLSPTFESLLRGLTETNLASADSSNRLSAPKSTTPTLESDLKSMNFGELKALNERLESEIKAARSSNSNRLSALMSSSIPEPPPQPDFGSQPSSSQSNQLSEDLYSRAKTIRIGKWRWPPALGDMQTMSQATAETNAKLADSQQKDDPASEAPPENELQSDDANKLAQASNAGRVKISSEMKAKLEQLTTTTSEKPLDSQETTTGDSCIKIESISQLGNQRRKLLERQLISGSFNSSGPTTTPTSSDRLSQELGANFNSSGKVLAAKQQLAAATGLDLTSSSSSANSSRRASAQVVPSSGTAIGPPPPMPLPSLGGVSVPSQATPYKQSEQLANDELGPRSRAAVNQREAFYGEKHLEPRKEKHVEHAPGDQDFTQKQLGPITSAIENNNSSWISNSMEPKQKRPADEQKVEQKTPKAARSEGVSAAGTKRKLRPAARCAPESDASRQASCRESSDLCLSYADISWQARIRKEFFLPSESYDDPQVLQLLFTQLVADVFNPRQWTRLNSKERALIKALMKDHSIGYSDKLPQVGQLDGVKLELVRLARSFGLYFTRSYPAQNLACLANDLLMFNQNNQDNYYLHDWEALQIMRQLLFENRLGLVWVDMIALHHTGVRLVSVVGSQPPPPQPNDSNAEQEQQPLGYKVIELLKFRDMHDAIALSHSELFVSMANGRRSWVLSVEQAHKVAAMLNWLHADYRESRQSPYASAEDQRQQQQQHAKKAPSRIGETTAFGDHNFDQNSLENSAETQRLATAADENATNNEDVTTTSEFLKESLQKLKRTHNNVDARPTKGERQGDALLASRLDSHGNCCEQRQIAPHKPESGSLSPPNDAHSSLGSNLLHDRAQIATNNPKSKSKSIEQQQQQKSYLSSSEFGACRSGQFEPQVEREFPGKLGADSDEDQVRQIRLSRKQSSSTSLSAWHNSLSRMSTSRLSLFSSKQSAPTTSSNKKKHSTSKESRLISNSRSEINEQDQEPQMSVAESMRIGLDTWIECKDDYEIDMTSANNGHHEDEQDPMIGDADKTAQNSIDDDCKTLTSKSSTLTHSQMNNNDNSSNEGQYSLLQFALYNFREALDKYGGPSDGGTASLKDANGQTNGKSIRGSLKLFETLRRGGTSKSNKLKMQQKNHHQQQQDDLSQPGSGEWTWRELAKMVKHSCEPIRHSLLKLPSDELDRRAVDCFAAILQYMGDIPAPSNKDSASSAAPTSLRLLEGGEIECVYLILMNCHNFVPLRDEIYAQLMKQTTSNRSPHNPDSCLRGWRLFSILAAFFQCSDSMRPYLVKYLETAAFDKRRAYCSVALICLQNLRKTFKYRGRKNVPSIEEIAATSAGRNSKRQIYRLPGGTERVINTRSSTVVEDIIQEICSTMLNVTDSNEMLEFSLYCIADGSDPYTMPLNREDYILDVTTELIKKHQQYFLIFCRSIWFYPLRLDSQLYIELIFNQIAPDYLEGLLLILPANYIGSNNNKQLDDAEDNQNPPLKLKRKLVTQISRLAALLHRASGTDYLPQEEELKYLLPKPIVSAIKMHNNNNNNNNDDNVHIDGDNELRLQVNHQNQGNNLMSVESSRNWLHFVQQDWSQMTSLDTLDAKAQFLQIIRHWPLFGSSFFACMLIQRDLLRPLEFILALNKLGIQMLDMESHQVVHKYSFNEIISTRKVRSEDGALFLDLKCGNLMKRTIIRIQTDQAQEISRLIRQYIDIDFLHSQPQSAPTSTASGSSNHSISINNE